jgi:hypothetical protein
MKKTLCLLFTLTVALALAVPASAMHWPLHKHGKSQAIENGKAHEKHAKKKGATKGKKEGQEGTAPNQGNQ